MVESAHASLKSWRKGRSQVRRRSCLDAVLCDYSRGCLFPAYGGAVRTEEAKTFDRVESSLSMPSWCDHCRAMLVLTWRCRGRSGQAENPCQWLVRYVSFPISICCMAYVGNVQAYGAVNTPLDVLCSKRSLRNLKNSRPRDRFRAARHPRLCRAGAESQTHRDQPLP